jgi:hypothetical protein
MNTIKIKTLGLLAVGALLPSLSQACASCGCTLSSDWENLGLSSKSGFTFDIRYDYLNQDRLRSGTSTISPQTASKIVNGDSAQEVESYTRNHYLTLGMDYNFNADWGLSLSLPYIQRSHSTLGTASDGVTPGEGGGQYDSHTSAIGDAKLIAHYQGFDEEHHLGVMAGIKLPTGSHAQTGISTDPANPGPAVIDRGLQPGTGTTDLILGAYYTGNINDEWDYFAQGIYQAALNSSEGYKPGNGLNLNAGLRYKGFNGFMPLLQLNARHVAHDTGVNADTVSTGGTLAYLSPGVVVPLSQKVSLYGFVQVPLYQNVRGVQLTPKYTASAGVRFSF